MFEGKWPCQEDRCLDCLLFSRVRSPHRWCSRRGPCRLRRKPANPSPRRAVATPINLNTATAADLQALPGVGAATARLIIEHRDKNGGFKKVEELMNIKGIGEKSFLKLKPMVTIAPQKAERQDDAGSGR